MNNNGFSDPQACHSSTGNSHYNTVTNSTRNPDSNTNTNTNTSSLLLTCAENDKGGGVSLNHVIFAIYSTAKLPSLWTDIVPTTPPATSLYVKRLQKLANSISIYLPICISWDDVRSLWPRENHQILSLNKSLPTSSAASVSSYIARDSIRREVTGQKPQFLINAALYKEHCIVGQGSIVETLLVVLRRPWCVLEICVSISHDIDVLQEILAFAKIAQERDYTGYSTAVFLLEYEIAVRDRQHRYQAIDKLRKCFGDDTHYLIERSVWSWAPPRRKRDSRFSSRRVYEMCNTVFIPSLKSFNSFWIRLLCVSAIELEVSFLYMVNMLCGQKYIKQDEKVTCVPRYARVLPASPFGQDHRRQSDNESYSTLCSAMQVGNRPNDDETTKDIIDMMVEVYKHALTRAQDCI